MLRVARVSSFVLILLSGCQQELDSAPAADPLEDPWVNSIDEGGEPEPLAAAALPAAAASPATPVAVAVDPAVDGLDEPGEPTPTPTPTEVAKLAGASSQVGKSTSASAGSIPEPTPTTPTPTPIDGAADPSDAVAIAAVDPTPAPAEPAKPAAPPPITFTDFAGKYRYTGGSSQRADLDQAIEDAANQLSLAIRGIGRKRLTNTNPIDDTLDIVVTGNMVQTVFETGFDAECEIDGGTVKWTSDKGNKYKVRVRKKDSKIVQVIEGEDGVKTTVFVLSADKQNLTVHHKVTSDRLDVPMTYKLSYKRK